MIETAEAVLDFWFGEAGQRGQPREEWFKKSDAFDALIRTRFAQTLEASAQGRLDDWKGAPRSALALIIVLDQFSRNIYRGTPRAFATDARALDTARQAIARGFDLALHPVERSFIYLPFEHAEELSAQREAVRLFETLVDHPESEELIDYAHRHFDVIARFGRFPHRNKILGRESTPEEIEFLKQPGSSF